MAKPICIVKVDMGADFGNGERPELHKLSEALERRLTDYHVFVIPLAYDQSEPHEPLIFQVFYEKDFTEIEYAELKEIINKSLN